MTNTENTLTPPPREQRQKVVLLSPEILADLLRQDSEHHFKIVENGIPEDGTVLAMRWDSWHKRMEVLVESPSFPVLEEGKERPILMPVAQTIPKL